MKPTTLSFTKIKLRAPVKKQCTYSGDYHVPVPGIWHFIIDLLNWSLLSKSWNRRDLQLLKDSFKKLGKQRQKNMLKKNFQKSSQVCSSLIFICS